MAAPAPLLLELGVLGACPPAGATASQAAAAAAAAWTHAQA